MKIAPICKKLYMLLLCYSFIHATQANHKYVDCEDDFEKPTIEFPELEGLMTGDTIFLVCASELLGTIQDKAVITDNCDPNPFVEFSADCEELPDCSLGFKYYTVYNWTVVDNNNNVCRYTMHAAIGAKRPPDITLNWGEGISSGDTIYMECGYGENFDESYVSVVEPCDPSTFCDASKPTVDVFFQETILSVGECPDYRTEMICKWYATGECGGQSCFELYVIFTDTTAPEFVDLADQYCGSTSMTEEEFAAYLEELSDVEVVDRCSDVDLSYHVNELAEGCEYLIQWDAIDECGNASRHEQLVCISSANCLGNISGTVRLDLDEDQLGDEAIPDVDLLLIEDINRNGIVDGGEEVYATTSTDENGVYSFTDVPQGCYVIVELQPSGYLDVKDEDVTNPGENDPDGIDDEVDNLIPVCISPGEFDDGNDFVEEQIILEIVLTAFTGAFNPESKLVSLQWETAYELNTDYFVLERSVDGNNFQELSKIESRGSQSNGGAYTFEDKSLSKAGEHLYRLIEVELDGSEHFSDVLSVSTRQTSSSLVIYPNPSNGNFSLMLPQSIGSNDEVQILVYDIVGNLVLSQAQTGGEIDIKLDGYAEGAYLLSIQSARISEVKKIYINRY